jgi:capsular polysaccharide biosynthesis protein
MKSVAECLAKALNRELRVVESFHVWRRGNEGRYGILSEGVRQMASCKPWYFDDDVCADIEMVSVSSYAAIFLDATVMGSSSMIIGADGKVIFDLPDLFGRRKNITYSDAGTVYRRRNQCILRRAPSKLITSGIKVCGNFSWNYYHFMFEIAAKFYYIDQHGIAPDAPLIVDAVCETVPAFREIIKTLNIEKRPIVYLKQDERVTCGKLYCFDNISIIPPEYSDLSRVHYKDCLFDPAALAFLRGRLVGNRNTGEFPKRIYLSRKNASARRPFNDEAVFEVLEPMGFQKVFPEEYTLPEQVALFYNAEAIAGGTGAAFTNILFCSRGCKAICFTNYKCDISIFSAIAALTEVDLVYMQDTHKITSDSAHLHDSFHIDCQVLSEFAHHFLNN